MVQLEIPKGLTEGQPFLIQMPNGEQTQFTVPAGMSGGDTMVVPGSVGGASIPVVQGSALPPPVVPENYPAGCCNPGGCCTIALARQQLGADGNVAMMRIQYTMEGCCGPAAPFQDGDMPPNMPTQLAQLGVTADEWAHAVKRLNADVNGMKRGMFNGPFLLRCFATVITLGLVCPTLCAERKKQMETWDLAMHKWQDEFNEKVLVPKGGFCKTQSLCFVTYGSKGEKQRWYYRWLAVAVQPHAVAHLRAEKHLFGDIENLSCCNGIDERKCCMHP